MPVALMKAAVLEALGRKVSKQLVSQRSVLQPCFLPDDILERAVLCELRKTPVRLDLQLSVSLVVIETLVF